VAAELRAAGIVDAGLTRCDMLAGGTTSRVAALSRPGQPPELVVKLTRPEAIRAEAAFRRTYAGSPLLPRLRFVDPAYRFLVCDFVPGIKVRYGEGAADTREVLLTLVRDLVGLYRGYAPLPGSQHGGVARLTDLPEDVPHEAHATGAADVQPPAGGVSMRWPQFLGDHVAYRHAALAPFVPEGDRRFVEQLARAERRAEAGPLSLLHGDCGAHNFLFEPGRADEGGQARVGRLLAAIDPDPLLGYPIYDLAFAFVSWPNGLHPEAIVPAAQALRAAGRWRPGGELQQVLWEEVLVALYMRTATCLVHHPQDLPAYLEAWPRWRAMLA
jgi:hypothetical protein